jgi:hypothetical protein
MMNTTEIKRNCKGCQYKKLKFVDGAEMETDWCALGNVACSEVKSCHPTAKVLKKKKKHGIYPEDM